MKYNKIINGEPLLDVLGNRIHAHGGQIIYLKDRYYLIGENKELTTGDNDIWHNGVRAYESFDLINWKDDGIIVQPSNDKNSTLHQTSFMDRPHIIYNKKNDEFIMWLKIMEKDGSQDMTILKSKSILGPYIIVKEHYHPFSFSTGDFDLIIDENSNIAYWFFEMVHNGFAVATLDENYTNAIEYKVLEEGTKPPYTREAMAYFKYDNRHFLLTSGTTGYHPNPTICYELESITGPIINKFRPHENDINDDSFNSQISDVIKIEGSNTYLTLADRWLPFTKIKYKDIELLFNLYTAGKIDEVNALKKRLDEGNAKTCESEYVILPIIFNGKEFSIKYIKEINYNFIKSID